MDTNIVVLKGHLIKDANLSKTSKGVHICSLMLIVNEEISISGTKEYEYRPNLFNIVIFGNYGKKNAVNIKKGREVLVTGRLHNEIHGEKITTQIIASNIELLRLPKSQEEKYECNDNN